MYKMIIATFGLTLAISLLSIEGHEFVILGINYVFFFCVGWVERSRQKAIEARANAPQPWEFGTPVEKKEKRNFAPMAH